MNENVETSLSEIIQRDFSRLETRCDEIFQRADAQFARLTSNGGFDSLQSFAARSFGAARYSLENLDVQTRPGVPFEIRLGSTSLTRQEASSLELNQIVPLTESTKGRVQIWSEGRRRGEGTLLVANGKLVVKIISFDGVKEKENDALQDE